MMRRIMVFLITMLIVFSLAACSSNHSGQSSSSSASGTVSKSSASISKAPKSHAALENTKSRPKGASITPTTNRMVIYTANMSITVRHFQAAQQNIQSLISSSGGYIVQSTFSKTANGKPDGSITARVPQSKFRSFMNQIAKTAVTVKNKNIDGKDVTKQYVDLNARLKAQQVVKQRLNTFLKQAKDANDLLKISNQLANVQQQIEQIKGQMQYLKNHSALATVTIHMSKAASGLKNQKDLNTWDKTKNAFIASLNLIVSSASALVVFFIGYSPILIILLIIAAIIYLVYRKRKK